MKFLLLLMVFVNANIHFRIWTRIRNPRVTDPDPAKVPGSLRIRIHNTAVYKDYFLADTVLVGMHKKGTD
jgi:hypothetical protein